MVIKAAPPLTLSEEHADQFVSAAGSVVNAMHHSTSFRTEALGLARRAINI
jgi:hypothetical protein